MQLLKIGEAFDSRYARQEGMMIRFNEVGFDLVACATNLNRNEIIGWKSGRATVAFHGAGTPEAIWCVKAGEISFDAPANFHLVGEAHRNAWLDTPFNLITLILLEKRNSKIAGLRAVGVEQAITDTFREAMRAQLAYERTQVDVANLRVLNLISTAELINSAALKQTFLR